MRGTPPVAPCRVHDSEAAFAAMRPDSSKEGPFDRPAAKASDESVPASDVSNASIFGNRGPSALPSVRDPRSMTKEFWIRGQDKGVEGPAESAIMPPGLLHTAFYNPPDHPGKKPFGHWRGTSNEVVGHHKHGVVSIAPGSGFDGPEACPSSQTRRQKTAVHIQLKRPYQGCKEQPRCAQGFRFSIEESRSAAKSGRSPICSEVAMSNSGRT
jgi:hypothetical protein